MLRHHYFRPLNVMVLPYTQFPLMALVHRKQVDVEEMQSLVVHAASFAGTSDKKVLHYIDELLTRMRFYCVGDSESYQFTRLIFITYFFITY